MSEVKKIMKLMDGSKLLYIGAIVSVALATVFQLATPLIVKFTVDAVIDGQSMYGADFFVIPKFIIELVENLGGAYYLAENLWVCSIAVITVAALQGIFAYFKGRWSAIASEDIAKSLKDKLYIHLQEMPYEYHVKAQTGDLIQRCTSDVNTVRLFLANQVIELARSLFIVGFSLYVLFQLNVRLTIVAVVTVPFIFLMSYLFFIRIKRQFLLVDEKEGELSTVLQENLSGVRVVRAFGRQQFETDKFALRNNEFKKRNISLVKLLAYFWGFSDLLSLSQVGLVLVAGVYMTVKGDITLGTLMVFTAYENMLVWPVRNMGRVLGDMGKMQVSLGRINEILNAPPETDTEGAAATPLKGEIVFNDVYFEYEKGKPVLNGLSFRVSPGETVALLGPTGSGKSTIMHILLRLYDYSGSVRINGAELRSIKKRWLRERIGIVLQEPFLYSKTIMNNIRMARDSVREDEIFAATRTAAVHDVIEDFEAGYDTLVGERGVTLSGGQKQRVAIARTLIKNSDILIFDDSLSAVDTETDAEIRRALRERGAGATTFIISQRITTLMEADRIFVIEHGKISDMGTHRELISREGLYSRIWNIQAMLEEESNE